MAATLCECGSGREYMQCCGQYHQQLASVPTAEALLRSRYSAYVREYSEYLNNTWHPSTRPSDGIAHNPALKWRSLEVVEVSGGSESEASAEIEFIANYTVNGRPEQLHERSRFIREAGQWLYVDGDDLPPLIEQSNEKIGRNDPCPCGSGKKYKKCCGAN